MLVTARSSIPTEDGLALIVRNLREAIGVRWARRQMADALAALLLARLGRLVARFATLAARVRASDIVAASRARHHGTAAPRSARPRLPEGFAWLCRLLPEAACFGGQLRHLLSLPETRALLADAPQLGRVLFPLCRMLSVEPDPEVRGWLPGYAKRRGSDRRRRPATSPARETTADPSPAEARRPAMQRWITPSWERPNDGTRCPANARGPGLARFIMPRAGPFAPG